MRGYPVPTVCGVSDVTLDIGEEPGWWVRDRLLEGVGQVCLEDCVTVEDLQTYLNVITHHDMLFPLSSGSQVSRKSASSVSDIQVE